MGPDLASPVGLVLALVIPTPLNPRLAINQDLDMGLVYPLAATSGEGIVKERELATPFSFLFLPLAIFPVTKTLAYSLFPLVK